jgi:hypothetical protein
MLTVEAMKALSNVTTVSM